MSAVLVKPDGTLVVTLRLTLKPARDAPLIALVRAAPPGGLAGAVREAMRSGIGDEQAFAGGEEEETFEMDALGIVL